MGQLRAVVTAHNSVQKNSNLGGRMIEPKNVARAYFCPMHSDVRQPTAGKCPKCGMDLLAEGTRFGLLRHMISSPLRLMVMAVLMAAVMAAILMMMR